MTAARRKRSDSRHVIAVSPPTAAWQRAVPRAPTFVRAIATTALEQGLQTLPARHHLRRAGGALEVSLVLTGDAPMRQLNRIYRGKDKPTNVLSFTADETAYPLLGDVIIAYGVARREAAAEDKSLKAHLAHLVVHGVLHLLDYDHGRDKDAAVMERLESKIMAGLGFADPYLPAAIPRRRTRQ